MDAWFKRRRFGWGWTPLRWQGWLVVLVALACIVTASQALELVGFVTALVAITSVLGLVSYYTSEEYLR